jgi:L-iditol 2-dehydrogenase
MKAAFAKIPLQIKLRDIPKPVPKPDEVIVKIDACGLCGTDVHIATKQAVNNFRPIGHEISGTIAELGSNVHDQVVGTPVIVQNSTLCGVCTACRNGEIDRCESIIFMKGQTGFAEYIAVHRRATLPYTGISPEAAAIVEPLGVALDVTNVADIRIGDNVAVIGPGPIGLMAVKMARLRGASNVLLAGNSHSKARLKAGLELGANHVVEVDCVNLTDYVKEFFPRGIDRVIVTSPPKTLLDAIEIANFGGIIAYIGIDYNGPEMVTFDVNKIHFKKLQIRASHAIPNTLFPVAVDLLARKVIDPDTVISHVFKLDDIQQAFDVAANDKASAIKVVVRC